VTEYVKSTNFASKDSLASGNPLKIVKGTEIDTELNNIATAVATKADLNGPTFIGVPTAPTASAGTNTTQLATTAFVAASATAVLQLAYPVGSIYINAGVTTNPATLLGFGTWTAFGAGRVIVGLNGSDALFDALEETGGSKDAVVVSHNHTGTTDTTSITGGFTTGLPTASGVFSNAGEFSGVGFNPQPNYNISMNASHNHTFTTGSTGSSGTNANLQPYITVAMWKRTA
jgi:hypothetical protein